MYRISTKKDPKIEKFKMMYFSGLFNRVLAFAIDFILMIIILVIGIILTDLLTKYLKIDNPGNNAGLLLFLGILTAFAILIYCLALESSKYQGTVGKIAMKIIVTDLQGRRISNGVSILRNIFKLIFCTIWLLQLIVILNSKKQQAIHDMISRTIVLKRQ